jgi:hypothetical protein
VIDAVTAQLTVFLKMLPPAELSRGLYWASCRAVAGGLDTTPLITAAVEAGLGQDEAQAVFAEAAVHIANARAERERVQA